MNKIYIPEGYQAKLDAYDTQRAIAYIKETFQEEFAKALNLKRASTLPGSGPPVRRHPQREYRRIPPVRNRSGYRSGRNSR